MVRFTHALKVNKATGPSLTKMYGVVPSPCTIYRGYRPVIYIQYPTTKSNGELHV